VRRSLRTQLVFWNICALALLLGALGLVVRYTVASTIVASVNRDLDSRTRHFGEEGPAPPPPGPNGPDRRGGPRPPPRHRHWFGRGDGDLGRPRLFGLAGDAGGPFGREPPWDAGALAQSRAGRTVYANVMFDGAPYRIISRPFPARGPRRGVVQAAYPLSDIRRALAGMDRALLLLIPLALLGAGVAGAWLTGRVLARVRGLTVAAGQIGAQDLSRRLPASGGDEFAELAATFNGLLGRLEDAFGHQARLMAQQRRFTGDASHELKTPLTVIQGNASLALGGPQTEAQYRSMLGEIDAAAGTMARLVGDLLLLARSDDGHLGRTRIEMLVREVLEQAAARGLRSSGPPIRLDIPDPSLSLVGSEDELVRLFANLLDNAARHTPAGGCITVSARRDGDAVVVTVADTGEGIAAHHLPHLGERFYRVDEARARADGGTGLGLSICRGIAEAHGGILAFESVLGQGTTVRLTLPLAAPATGE